MCQRQWIELGKKYIDFERGELVTIGKDGESTKNISGGYLAVLKEMTANEGRIYTFEQIARLAHGEDYWESDDKVSCRNLFAEIRKKTGLTTSDIQSVRNLGYKFVSRPKCRQTPTDNAKKEHPRNIISEFVENSTELQTNLLNSMFDCSCFWGTCSFDTVQQNANAAEGLLTLVTCNKSNEYKTEFETVLNYLLNELSETGLKSKSLKKETVAPTSMFLTACDSIPNDAIKKLIEPCIKNLWAVKDKRGWGIYAQKMNQFSTIGFSYWALNALENKRTIISDDEFGEYVITLLCYKRNSAKFAEKIGSDAAPRMYATSMMFILYNMLSNKWKTKADERYDAKKAIDFIMKDFDNDHFLTESESVGGTELSNTIDVHDVPWNHISIHFSLKAIAMAIESGMIGKDDTCRIVERLEKVLKTHCLHVGTDKSYFKPPYLNINYGNRGYLIYPTMHLLMGLWYFTAAIERYREDQK